MYVNDDDDYDDDDDDDDDDDCDNSDDYDDDDDNDDGDRHRFNLYGLLFRLNLTFQFHIVEQLHCPCFTVPCYLALGSADLHIIYHHHHHRQLQLFLETRDHLPFCKESTPNLWANSQGKTFTIW